MRWLLGTLAVVATIHLFVASRGSTERVAYTELKALAASGSVEEAWVSLSSVRARVRAEGAKPARYVEAVRVDDPDLLHDLVKQSVKVSGVAESSWLQAVLGWAPLLLLGILWLLPLGRIGPRSLLATGQSKAKLYVEQDVKTTFADVAGVDEAKDELAEVIEFLRTPERFARLGGHIPKGVLLVGPPGTGKTLLARAVAGEAGVPFFSISGSEFVEMFVGVGAARVRDLFAQAKERAPCIIFLDELDALGKARGAAGFAGGNEEREQTLNQLLVELDGFDPRVGVILMAATNRPEILDPALLRPGRFDRHLLVDRPDRKGRLAILKLHARAIPLDENVRLDDVAAMTAGFVGADLANLVNEGALLAVRRGKNKVGRLELQEALERVVAGLEKRNRLLNAEEKKRVAHHEVGHALVALALPGVDSVQKISIVPRGIAALGYTLQLPREDRFLLTEGELRDKLAVALGGRVAEQISFGDHSTGAEDDIVKATRIARSMVVDYGMSRLGPMSFGREGATLLDPKRSLDTVAFSEGTRRRIEAEVARIIDEAEERAREILTAQGALLGDAAALLLAHETMSGEELRALAKGRTSGAVGAA